MKLKNLLLFVLFSSIALSGAFAETQESPEQVETSGVIGFVTKDGFFVSGNLGIFSGFGGYKTIDTVTGTRKSTTMSDIQPFVALTFGYDFSRNVGLGLKLASAFVSDAARSPSDLESPTDLGLYMTDLNVMGAVSLTKRFRLTLNGFGGLTFMHPPITMNGGNLGVNAGASLGILYDTLLADMLIGLNLTGYAFINFNGPGDANKTFFAASITPELKYVF